MSKIRGRNPLIGPLLAALALALLPIASGCNVTRAAARFAGPVLESGTAAFESEPDVAFAREAAPSNLKLLEGLLREAPENRDLLTLACRGHATYAFGFLDPEVERARIDDPSAVPELERRLDEHYARAFEYGRRALRRGLGEALTGDDARFEAALARQRRADVPQLFWTAYAWGALIQLDVTNAARLAAFPRVQAMMLRVLELDEAYYFGGAHLFFGVLYAQLPPGGGGDPVGARTHFDRAREITHGELLMVDLLQARYLAVRLQDHAMFRATLESVAAARPTLEPARLANEIAKQRARFYLQNVDAFFLDIPSGDTGPAAVDVAPEEPRP